MSERGIPVPGDQLQPGDLIRTSVPRSDWYGQIERLEPHRAFERWQVAHFFNAYSISIDPDATYFVKRPEAT